MVLMKMSDVLYNEGGDCLATFGTQDKKGARDSELLLSDPVIILWDCRVHRRTQFVPTVELTRVER